MTEKLCQLYEEEQVGKTREEKKSGTSKQNVRGWDIAETQLQEEWKSTETQDKSEHNATHTTPCFQVLITVAIIITAILEHIAVYVREIPKIAKKIAQAVKSMTMKAGCNKLIQNIKDSYRTAALAITIATSSMDCTDHRKQPLIINRNTQFHPGTRKLNDEYNGSYQSHTSRAPCNSSN